MVVSFVSLYFVFLTDKVIVNSVPPVALFSPLIVAGVFVLANPHGHHCH